jgi:hypothetical protein
MAAFRMALDPAMQQVVKVALGIPPTTVTTADFVLDRIADYVCAKRNITLDRVVFEERRQERSDLKRLIYVQPVSTPNKSRTSLPVQEMLKRRKNCWQ